MSLLLNNNVINKVFYNNNVGYTVVGTPTISDNIVSNFSSTDNIQTSQSFVDNGQDFKFVLYIKTPANAAYTGILSVGNSAYSAMINFRADKKIAANIVRGYGDVTSPMPNIFTQELALDTWYYIKWERINNVHTISHSIDGVNYTTGDSATCADHLYNNGGKLIYGWHSAYLANGYIGSINLNNTYVKINNITWFNGKEQTSIDVDYLALNNDIIWIKNPFNKPADWYDIRTDCPANSIALYTGHATDFSSYDNLGFTATCIGGYKVFIDGVQYGSTYASGAKCSITWSTSGITTGDIVTTPSLLKAHKIWIEPATEGNDITNFHCARVATSRREAQGILWAHFNIDNEINLGNAFATYNSYYEPLMLSMTAKNNVIKCNKLPMFGQSSDLAVYANNIEYLPIFDLNNNTINGAAGSFNLLTTAELEKVILKNGTITGSFNSFACNATKLKRINTKNVVLQPTLCQQAFQNNQSIEEIPDIDFTNATNLTNFITNAVALKDTVLDTRAGAGIVKIGCYGTSQYFMSGFKGLRVSNEAPFNNATPPQINVSYTGMNRDALVQLFNDLPYNVGYTVVGSPTIADGFVSGFSASDYLRLEKLPDFSGNVEMVIKFKISTFSGDMASWITNGIRCFVRFNAGKTINIYFSRMGDNSTLLSLSGNYVFSENTDYYVKIIKTEDNKLSVSYSTDGTNYILDNETQNENAGTVAIISYFRWGVSGAYNPTNPFDGEIDFNKTYIKTNGVPFFRGTAAMTKSINLVGATGTADLTADDKDIALNKGWSLTLS